MRYGAGSGGGAEVFVSVKDTGSGIAADVMSHIFEPFFTTKAETNGSGLGLAIAHGIIAQHGGTITVQSEPGKGAEFVISLPLTKLRRRSNNNGGCV